MVETIKIVNSDVLKMSVDVVAHQVNCKGVMGAGLAKQIRELFPDVYHAHHNACTAFPHLLGCIQLIRVPGNMAYIANLYAQYDYGVGKRYTNYHALEHCLIKLREAMLERRLATLALPYGIGCGLGGGEWDKIYPIIEKVFTPEYNISVFICKNVKEV